jgi:hypothetical protein
MGVKDIRDSVEKSSGCCWKIQLDLVFATVLHPLNLQRLEVLGEMQRLLDLEFGPRGDD